MKLQTTTPNAIVSIIMCFLLLAVLAAGCQTSSPGMVGTRPANGATAVATSPATVQITFDQPMDRVSVETAFAIRPAVGTDKPAFAWSDNDKVVVATFAQPLKYDTDYTVSVGAGARAASAVALAGPAAFSFKTAPTAVAGTTAEPAPGETSPALETPTAATGPGAETPVAAEPSPSFAKDIQPIAKSTCDGCHAPQATGKMSDYNNIISKKFVIANDPDNSPYYKKGSGLVTHSGGDAWKANKQLVRDWITAGAPK